MKTGHLTNEQFTELLAGECASNAALAHLEGCGSCQQELEVVRTAVGDLREMSMRWAEARASRIAVPTRWALSWHRLPGLSAAASLLLCGVAIGVHFQGNLQPVVAVSQTQTVAAAPSQDELAQDNQLLRSIHQELSQQVTPLVPASELTVSSRALRHHEPREVAN